MSKKSDPLSRDHTITNKLSSLNAHRTVLLVDDIAPNRELVAQYLKKLGYKVTLACDGQEAIKRYQQQKPDLILMDCQMPIMDGFTACLAIRKLEDGSSHIPILALTAGIFGDFKKKIAEHGIDGFLSKPIVLETLEATLDKWLPIIPLAIKNGKE